MTVAKLLEVFNLETIDSEEQKLNNDQKKLKKLNSLIQRTSKRKKRNFNTTFFHMIKNLNRQIKRTINCKLTIY